jgi:hypothetical protein
MTAGSVETGTFEGLEVGKITGHFLVPAYQRGYRWTDLEVTRLLQDIRDSEGATYYLQPIVVRPLGDNRWELIDGQQRLTTLALIVRYFKRYVPMADLDKYTIEYETRPQSAQFLKDPTAAEADTNIDFFHMYAAWEAIGTWLDEREDASTAAFEIYTALQRRVKVIWYEAPETADSTELFTRLNVGRIPLTDSELVKALVLSRSRDIQGADRALSVAAEWDVIERDLRDPELWAVLTATAEEEATHISLLLDLLADQVRAEEGLKVLRRRQRPPFHTFETLRPWIVANPEGFWNRVVDLHSLVRGWFEERNAFHKIGYLTACRVRIDEVLAQAAGATKSQFYANLDRIIANDPRCLRGLQPSALHELAYGEDDELIKSVLLLMNVETVRKLTNSTERYSFRAHAARKDRWSLEHIHAQNSAGLNTVEQWAEWLRQHRDALADLPTISSEARADLEARIDAALPIVTLERFQELEDELRVVFSPGDRGGTDDEHAISNLALLERDDNSSVSNAVFEVKRQRILALDRAGSYIPICTRNVFLKYYTTDRAQQLHFWSPQDRTSYLAAIEREVGPYLKLEVVA